MMLKKVNYIQIAIIFLLCINIQSTYAQQQQTMLQKENLKGKVKSVYVTDGGDAYVKVNFDETGKITRKERQWREDYRIVRDNYVYDEEGRLISVRINNQTEFIYTYSQYRVCFHDKKGTCPSCTIDYTYDKNGNCISETSYLSSLGNGCFRVIARIYNETNQLVEAFSYEVILRSMGRRSDGRGETIQEEPKKENHAYYEYNKFGDVSRITVKTEDGKTKTNVTYKSYDAKGNWLERTCSTDSPFEDYQMYETYLDGRQITRIIEYY